MDHFQIEISEPKPILSYALRAQLNLHSGKTAIDHLAKGEDLIFERIHTTHKAKLTFAGAERREGIIYIYLIVLDNNHAYLYIIGETNGRPIIRGGPFMEIEDNGEEATAVITAYIEANAKKMADAYARPDSSALIDAINQTVNKLRDLMPD